MKAEQKKGWHWEHTWEPDSESWYDGSMGQLFCDDETVLWFGYDGAEGIYCSKKDRAEFITKACNAYADNQDTIAELVKALGFIKTLVPSVSGPDRDKLIIRGMRSIAEAALAKVGDES